MTMLQGRQNETPFQRSCTQCYERKVKCNRSWPCSNCTKLGEECVFPTTRIRRNRHSRHRRADRNIGDWTRREDVGISIGPPAIESSSCFGVVSTFIPQMRANRDESSHWMPTPGQLRLCWQIYVNNIDPFVKILHRPSIDSIVQRVQSEGFATLGIEESALLLAICFCAIASMPPGQCKDRLHLEKGNLFDRIKRSAQLAINLAELFQRPDIRTLQAFTLVLTCCGETHTRASWLSIGTALRIARILRLHGGNARFERSIFEEQIGLRLWWHLQVLDFATALQLDCLDSSYTFVDADIPLPLNVNDSDLDPAMEIVPFEHQNATEMSFCLLRWDIFLDISEVLKQHHFKSVTPILAGTEQILQDVVFRTCQRHLQCFTTSSEMPLSRLCCQLIQSMPTRIGILLKKSVDVSFTSKTSTNTIFPTRHNQEDVLFSGSIQLLQFHIEFSHDERMDGWTWIFGASRQWNVAQFVLSQLEKRASQWTTTLDWGLKALHDCVAVVPDEKDTRGVWKQLEDTRLELEKKLVGT